MEDYRQCKPRVMVAVRGTQPVTRQISEADFRKNITLSWRIFVYCVQQWHGLIDARMYITWVEVEIEQGG